MDVEKGARISADGIYRYSLWRFWGAEPPLVFVMLNPSTADATTNDKTITRCMGFARRDGFGGIAVVNLYALRATKPEHLLHHPDPEGPDNCKAWDGLLESLSAAPITVVAAWGAGGPKAEKDGAPASQALAAYAGPPMVCLGHTPKSGAPCHPLYLEIETPMVPYVP